MSVCYKIKTLAARKKLQIQVARAGKAPHGFVVVKEQLQRQSRKCMTRKISVLTILPKRQVCQALGVQLVEASKKGFLHIQVRVGTIKGYPLD